MEPGKPDLVGVAKLDSKGRIVIDGEMRDRVKLREGERLMLSLVVAGDGAWMISMVRVPSK